MSAFLKKALKWMMQSMSMFMSWMMQFMSMSMPNQQAEAEEEKAGSVSADDIPEDIWREIGKRLESRLDVSRFRSVCRTWRRGLPPPLRFPLKVPRPPGSSQIHESRSHFLSEVTFYAAAASNQIFLFEEGDQGGQFSASAMVHENQIVSYKIRIPPISYLSFLSNAYHVHTARPARANCCVEDIWTTSINPDVLKIAIICSDGAANPNYPELSHLKVVAHLTDWKLAVLSLSGGAMTNHWETGFCDITFDDIVNYRGRLYGVDNLGRAFVMDYDSLHMTQVAPALPPNSEIAQLPPFFSILPLPDRRKLMHLVVVSEELYMFIYEPHNLLTPRLYKLKLGKWVEADQDLPDRVFIQNLQCNFPAPRDLSVPCHNDSVMTYELPRFCSLPKFLFVRVDATGFNDTYDNSRSSCRLCDLPAAAFDFYRREDD